MIMFNKEAVLNFSSVQVECPGKKTEDKAVLRAAGLGSSRGWRNKELSLWAGFFRVGIKWTQKHHKRIF